MKILLAIMTIVGIISPIRPTVVTNVAQTENVQISLIEEQIEYRTVTAYSSTPDQTDDAPFISASGQHVRKGICASNEFPFGTKIKVGDYVCEIQDRMNRRYPDRIDIWFPSRKEALEFGIATLTIKIL